MDGATVKRKPAAGVEPHAVVASSAGKWHDLAQGADGQPAVGRYVMTKRGVSPRFFEGIDYPFTAKAWQYGMKMSEMFSGAYFDIGKWVLSWGAHFFARVSGERQLPQEILATLDAAAKRLRPRHYTHLHCRSLDRVAVVSLRHRGRGGNR